MIILKPELEESLFSTTSIRPFTALYMYHTAISKLLSQEKSNSVEVPVNFSKLKEQKKNLSIKLFRKWLFSVIKINGSNTKCNNVKMN
jgi:hypothetical protein